MSALEPPLTCKVIICGPPPKCTCPAVAWYCICAASRRTQQPIT